MVRVSPSLHGSLVSSNGSAIPAGGGGRTSEGTRAGDARLELNKPHQVRDSWKRGGAGGAGATRFLAGTNVYGGSKRPKGLYSKRRAEVGGGGGNRRKATRGGGSNPTGMDSAQVTRTGETRVNTPYTSLSSPTGWVAFDPRCSS
ncbi:uncharacterized protein LY79DRAFT_399655 [Colletotrichum navitas]|uniref:Uncharacterized protein n=1 Tax=Colletotrichum navitas TaxID=681940 RepID=A0AAD8V0W2_9PEZI|nr:uncharacterized protein LY79DRAFT_399655 [Colletotrichum navitas]KAK1573705.1 hypothetical protein LY79DRAFT_399655 [Colletotrichum navitas]